MKKKNKFLAVLFALVTLISMTGFTANAATRATSITYSKTNDMIVRVGYAITRAAVTTPEGLAVTYTSSDATTAAVNENGQVVGKKPGKSVITASAGGLNASYNVVVTEAVSTKVFDGFTVTVLDKKIPAVTIMGRTTDRNVMCFLSADGKETGSISYSDYNAIIRKNQKVVNLPGGGTYGAPPVDGKSWEAWFADEFNKYRGLDAGSRQEAVAEAEIATAQQISDTIEKYRMEVIRLTNLEREKAGLPEYQYDNENLSDFAQVRAGELSVLFSHTRPDGTGSGTENIAMGQRTPADVVKAWMDSPGHKANILKPASDPSNGIVSCTHIGVGCYYKNGTFYWVQLFGYGSEN